MKSMLSKILGLWVLSLLTTTSCNAWYAGENGHHGHGEGSYYHGGKVIILAAVAITVGVDGVRLALWLVYLLVATMAQIIIQNRYVKRYEYVINIIIAGWRNNVIDWDRQNGLWK